MEFRKKIIGLWSWKQQLKYTMNKKGKENEPIPSQGQLKKVDAQHLILL